MKPRVAILFNSPVLPVEHPDYASETEVVSVAHAVLSALKTRGFRPFLMAARPPIQRLVNTLVKKHPDVVFNLIEGFGGHSGGESHVTSLLELMKIPYTGCPPACQALGRHKAMTKRLLLGSGLPTAQFWSVEPGDPLPFDPWPGTLFVKPESEDASLGISQENVVTTPDDLANRLESIRKMHGPQVLIETYLPGPEFNIGVLALPHPVALPVAEIVYVPTEGQWPILSYEAKWHVGSKADLASLSRCPAEIDPTLANQLAELAVRAFRVSGCRDYARIDMRLNSKGEPMILEVNPNPDLDPSAGFAKALIASGRDWAETIVAIAHQALARG